MAWYVTVPKVPGVPVVLALPQMAIDSVVGSLSAAANGIAGIAEIISSAPTAAAVILTAPLAVVSGNLAAATATIAAFPSSIMNGVASGVAIATSDVDDISASISSDPSAPVGGLSDQVDGVSATLDDTSQTLSDSSAGLGDTPAAMTADDVSSGAVDGPQWGIFNSDGKAIVTADNVVAFEYKQDWAIADFPLERGAFESYDKVWQPFDARIMFSSGGTVENRQKLLASIDAIAGDLNLYDIITPEKHFVSVNVAHYDIMKRSSNDGAGLVKVNIWLKQINETAAAAFAQPPATSASSSTVSNSPASNAAQPGGMMPGEVVPAKPSGATPQSAGQVQPVAASVAQQKAVEQQVPELGMLSSPGIN